MFLPSTIDLGQSEKYSLSIRISADRFMFSISDPQDRKNYCLRETELPLGTSLLESIKRIVFDFNFLTQQYSQTNVVIVSSEYDLVPREYYDHNMRKEMDDFVHWNNAGQILSAESSGGEYITMYNIDKDLYEFLSRNLYAPLFYHHSYLLVNYVESQVNSALSKMFVYSHDGMFDVLSYVGEKLTHALSYREAASSDQAYYILKLWENCGLNQLSDTLYIAGDFDESIVSVLQKYIKKIEKVGAFSDIYLWSEDAQKAPLDLLSLSV